MNLYYNLIIKKDMLTLCCNMCGWFSVIGSGLYIVLGIMITNRNKAVVEHKFKLPSFTEGAFKSYDGSPLQDSCGNRSV